MIFTLELLKDNKRGHRDWLLKLKNINSLLPQIPEVKNV